MDKEEHKAIEDRKDVIELDDVSREKQEVNLWASRLVKFVPGSTAGSKLRRVFTYVSTIFILLLAFEIGVFPGRFTESMLSNIMTHVVVGMSILYFVVVVVAVVFLTSQEFRVAPIRLARDTLVSMCFIILSFALLYRKYGISLSEKCSFDFSAADSLYFSAVTFSTLGYGDFRPCPASRLWAASEALIGNLHLGLIVGAAFLLAGATTHQVKPKSEEKEQEEDQLQPPP